MKTKAVDGQTFFCAGRLRFLCFCNFATCTSPSLGAKMGDYNNEAIAVVILSSLCLIALVTCCPAFWPYLFQLQAPGGGISAMLCGTLLEGGHLVTSLVLGSILLAQHDNRDDVGGMRTAMWVSFSISMSVFVVAPVGALLVFMCFLRSSRDRPISPPMPPAVQRDENNYNSTDNEETPVPWSREKMVQTHERCKQALSSDTNIA